MKKRKRVTVEILPTQEACFKMTKSKLEKMFGKVSDAQVVQELINYAMNWLRTE